MSWLLKTPKDLGCFEGIDGINNIKVRHRLKKHFFDDSYRINPYQRPNDKKLFKFWKNRATIFKLINNGNIYLTDELWFSVTPENLAQFTANYVRHCLPNGNCIVDVFCGGGGNTIQFARLFEKVYGIDSNIDHLYCAYKNAECYNSAVKLKLIYGDWEESLKKTLVKNLGKTPDCIFASPPWGGVDYLRQDTYDLEEHLQPSPLSKILSVFFSVCQNVVLFLPRNSDLDQLSSITHDLLGPDEKCKVVYVKDNGYMKGILAFWGRPFYDFSEYYPTEIEEEESHELNNKRSSKDLEIKMEDLY
ncbi:RNA methyltransferase [Kluyveromyces lactis]|uniref:Trimethylguanosine synthase n=1 Tax=Kluyveromyces lactis (strain ATCC 8585 / CBS 2359 / DSM 70799 / NBRC 1267 / NRRL Y-1140 / WM37) TaxID=284590 RepID=Q6CRW0_KLULA|nr:uncharacterized protein KLLA0_D05995g [Kluyveromyces lactis]CAH00425.1 KLLA0D05995p [Kluyveromyces lactis]|eukprot:XP_453329.1 uncharacterized protein KLLA0_D05995g [Kluyveromyces lactis]